MTKLGISNLVFIGVYWIICQLINHSKETLYTFPFVISHSHLSSHLKSGFYIKYKLHLLNSI